MRSRTSSPAARGRLAIELGKHLPPKDSSGNEHARAIPASSSPAPRCRCLETPHSVASYGAAHESRIETTIQPLRAPQAKRPSGVRSGGHATLPASTRPRAPGAAPHQVSAVVAGDQAGEAHAGVVQLRIIDGEGRIIFVARQNGQSVGPARAGGLYDHRQAGIIVIATNDWGRHALDDAAALRQVDPCDLLV